MAGEGVVKASELRTKTKLDLEKQAVRIVLAVEYFFVARRCADASAQQQRLVHALTNKSYTLYASIAATRRTSVSSSFSSASRR
jgi:hypothetical protein